MKRFVDRLFPLIPRVIATCGLLAWVVGAQAQEFSADAYEPDDTPAQAKGIANGETQNRSIAPSGDVDWVSFTIGVNGAANVRIETGSVGGDWNTELWLYESRNLTKEIAYNDDATPNTRSSLIALPNLPAGTYYIRVGAVGLITTIPGYTLRATWTDRSDNFEPDNVASSARTITNGQPQERSIHVASDEDWVAFTIGRNGATNVRIETDGTSGDSEIILYGPNSATAQLAQNDDKPGSKFSLITLPSLAAGTYFVRVTSFGLTSTISAYTLRVTWSETGDSFEPDDTAATAKPISNGQAQTRSIHTPTDTDWATFVLGANGAANVRIETSGTTGDTEIWLYGPNNATTQIAYNDDGPTGKFSQINVSSLSPGTYYVKVGEFGANATITEYTLRATWSEGTVPLEGDSFEVDDAPTAAKTIANGHTQNRSIHRDSDTDWVAFTIDAAGASNVRIETAGSSGDTEMWLYGPNSATELLDYNDDSENGKFASLVRASLQPGLYYVRITSYRQSSRIAAYTLRVTWQDGLPAPSRLANLSIRTNAGLEAQTVIVGFVLSGVGTKPLLIRGIGPTLSTFGVTGVMTDPFVQLYNRTTVTASNDNWGGTAAIRDAAASVGAFTLPDNSRDGALLQSLAPSNYSVIVTGGTGVVLVEAYEVGAAASPRLSNVSARAHVGTGSDTLIAGFVIAGIEPKKVLIRAIGPSLAQFGVADTLTDPRLDLYRGPFLIESNDNWGGTAELTASFSQVGAFPLQANSRDAALQLVLVPGAYSAQITGVNAATGVALVEVYELP